MPNHQNIFFDAFEIPYAFYTPVNLCNKVYSNVNFVQRLSLERKLKVHNGCVNTICWNDSGQYLLSGSDDQKLVIADPFKGKVKVSVQSGHRANIFSAKFMPNTRDRQVVSCSGDGLIYYTNLDRTEILNGFDCHSGTTYEVLTVPQDPHSFLSCGEDGTVRWYDLRIKDKCTKEDCKEDVLINCRRAVTAIATNPLTPYHLAVGCSDSTVRIFDRRMLGTKATGNYTSRGIMGMISRFSAPGLENRHHRITCLNFSQDGEEILASYSSEQLYLFNLKENGHGGKEFSTSADPNDLGARPKSSARQPPIKRLRLRGDWSDTGPSARPERERGDDSNNQAAATIMQRMSDMLTRWLEGAARQTDSESEQPTDDPSANQGQGSEEAGHVETGSEGEQGQGHGEGVTGVIRAEDRRISSETSDIILGGPLPCIGISNSRANEKQANGQDKLSKIAAKKDGDTVETSGISSENSSALAECDIDSSEGQHVKNDSNRLIEESHTDNVADECTCNGTSSVEHCSICKSSQAESSSSMTRQVGEGKSSNQTHDEPVKPESPLKKEMHVGTEGQQSLTTTEESRTLPETPSSQDVTLPVLEEISSVHHAVSQALSGSTVEPLVSLSYTPQGTCASTIRVRCGLHTGIQDVGLSRGGNETDSVSLPASRQDEQSPTLAPVESASSGATSDSSGDVNSGNLKIPVVVLDEAEKEAEHVEETTETVDSEMEEGSEAMSEKVDTASMVSVASAESLDDKDPDVEITTAEGATNGTEIPVKDAPTCLEDTNPSTSGLSGPRPSEDRTAGGQRETPEDSEEEDSDTERMRAVRRSRRGRWGPGTSPAAGLREDDATKRNAAARKLQELYRKRQEEREQEELEQMQLPQPRVKQQYSGHRNSRTMIKEACFWGRDFVMSGSDCGHVFIWNRYTTELVMLLEGDRHVVNCVQPHPYDPVLATSGIDYDIKLWSPCAAEPCFDEAKANEILKRNKVMLEETKDTITVPASFMLRMLASLNHFHSARRARGPDGESSPSSEEDDD